MFVSPNVRIAVAAVLVSSSAIAQETNLEEVVVTATALRRSPLEVAQPTRVVAGDELRRQISSSLGETLSGELGVSSTYFGPVASRPVIRGLSGDRVQVLQDGRAALDVSALSPDHAVTVESVVSRQIEVMKGPAALLYGSGAAGGLVNVVTNRIPMQKTEDPVSGSAEVRGDTAHEERTYAIALDGGKDLLALHADYFDRETDDVEFPDFAQSDALRDALIDEGLEPDGVRGSIPNTWSEAKGGALGMSVVGESAAGGVSWSPFATQYGIPGEEEAYIDMDQDRIDAKLQVDLDGAITSVQLSGAYNDYTHTEFEAPGEPGTIFNQDAYELRVALDHELGDQWRGTGGVQYVDTDFKATGEEAYVPPSTTTAASLFLFEERQFDDWTVELGARAELQEIDVAAESGRPDFDDTAWSLSAGTVWRLSNDDALAFNLTRTQRNPQAVELYANGPHLATQRFEIGDPGLDQETAITADVSLRRVGDGLQWTLNAFYNDYSDYILAEATGDIEDELPVFVYLQDGVEFYGFEAELIYPLLDNGGRRLDLRVASDYVRGKRDDGGDLPQIPALRVGTGLHLEVGAWHAGTDVTYYDRQSDLALNELPTPSFTMLDADVSYRLPLGSASVFLFARGTNLLDEDARLHTSPLKDIAPLPGRSLHLGARAEF